MSEAKSPAYYHLQWRLPSKRQILTEHQAQFLGNLIQELNDVVPWEFNVNDFSEIDINEFAKIFDNTEYIRFMGGLYACGFVSQGYKDFFDLEMANLRPQEVLGDCDLAQLRWYLHTLARAEKWAEHYSSPVLEALCSGALQIVGKRLIGDERLRGTDL